MMKLSQKTTSILKNFSLINESIVIKKGSVLGTVSPSKSILAKAKVEETFDREFAIHQLPKFLSVLSFMEKPEITLHTDHLSIEEGQTKVTFRYGNPSLIVSPPDRELTMTSEVKFKLEAATFQTILKAQGSMQLPQIAIKGDTKGIFIAALDPKNSSGDSFSIQVGESNGHEFQFNFVPTNLKFLNLDYDVSISAKGLMYLKGDVAGQPVEYWVPAEASSTYK